MYIFTLVKPVSAAIEKLRRQYGDYKLAMLYNLALGLTSNWNLIVSSDWTDRLGVAEATKIIARELFENLGLGEREAMSRITVLKTTDPFVRDMTQFTTPLRLDLGRSGDFLLDRVVAGEITEGAGYVFYSQPEVPA